MIRVTRSFSAKIALALTALWALSNVFAQPSPADWYVSPAGTGNGSITSPWGLQTALSQPAAVHPGDTIWLRGGTYTGAFDCRLQGTAGNLITVKNYTGEHVVIDRNLGNSASSPTIAMNSCQYVRIMGVGAAGGGGIEITNSSTDRPQTFDYRATGIRAYGTGIQLINLVIHDQAIGIAPQNPASTNFLAYGNLIYYNGNQGNEHGIYPQNAVAPMTIDDNMFLFNAGRGLHAYGSSPRMTGFRVNGNMAFGNGALGVGSGGTQYLFVSGSYAITDTIFSNNYGYGVSSNEDCAIGNDTGFAGPLEVKDNFLVMNLSTWFPTGATVTGNTVYPLHGAVWNHNGSNDKAWYTTNYPSNTWASIAEPTSGKNIFVRPNAYEAGRGHVYIFNWDLSSSVNVDLSSVLSVGARYEVRYALNYYGPTVASGTYGGGTVSIPVNSLTMAKPVGLATPTSLAPKISAFVVLTVAGSSTSTPTPTATPTPLPPTPTPTRTPTITRTPTPTPTRTWTNLIRDQHIGALEGIVYTATPTPGP